MTYQIADVRALDTASVGSSYMAPITGRKRGWEWVLLSPRLQAVAVQRNVWSACTCTEYRIVFESSLFSSSESPDSARVERCTVEQLRVQERVQERVQRFNTSMEVQGQGEPRILIQVPVQSNTYNTCYCTE
jgi:hypothetical protein